MRNIATVIEQVADSDVTVLIRGESGVGKELVSRAIHQRSTRRNRPFVKVNCAALPAELLESELFGHERGAFTGAATTRIGKFEQADGGTLFMDEIGEMKPALQAKLLHVLQDAEFTKLGSNKRINVDVRVVAATNRDLEAESRAGRFRQDLLFRLSAAVVELPPLRHRPREVPVLARLFVAEACARAGRPVSELSEATLQRLASYAWPGNVRELKNTVDFAVATADGASIEPWNLPDRVAGRAAPPASPASPNKAASEPAVAPEGKALSPAAAPRRFQPIAEELRELERTRMLEALEETGWVQTRAAELIGMPTRTFTFKLKQYGISTREAKLRQG
jgi:two-component system, NtrC family, response regulator AtoC